MAKSFTLTATGVLRAIITPCGVCPAFDPLSASNPPKIEQFKALWDTGATGSVINKSIVDKLGLRPFTKTKVYHADGESIVNVYAVNIFLPNQVGFSFVKVSEGKIKGADLLIGMDIITKGDMALTHIDGKTKFSFRCPPTAEIDFVAEIRNKRAEASSVKTEPVMPKVGRNDPCPCGSHKKYKNCHGR